MRGALARQMDGMPISKLGLIKAGFFSLPAMAVIGWHSYLPHTPSVSSGDFSIRLQLDSEAKLRDESQNALSSGLKDMMKSNSKSSKTGGH